MDHTMIGTENSRSNHDEGGYLLRGFTDHDQCN